jgi:hypothetical protein
MKQTRKGKNLWERASECASRIAFTNCTYAGAVCCLVERPAFIPVQVLAQRMIEESWRSPPTLPMRPAPAERPKIRVEICGATPSRSNPALSILKLS